MGDMWNNNAGAWACGNKTVDTGQRYARVWGLEETKKVGIAGRMRC